FYDLQSNKVKASLDKLPKPARILIAATLATTLLIGGYLGLAPMMRDYEVLYSELDPEDAAAVVEVLKKRAVDYRLTGGGTTVEVPEDEADEMRLALAGEGLPRGGQVGFESFQKMRLGATEFEQHATYQSAMEGELARTISAQQNVMDARVHLVLPKKSVFASRQEPASAAITVKLRPGRELDTEQIAAIVYLVSSAVPSLEPEGVSLNTTTGRVLHQPGVKEGKGGLLGQDEASRDRDYEASLEREVQSLLESLLGPGNAQVRIRADIDRAEVERKSDHFDPKHVIRSEDLEIEGNVAAEELDRDTVAGVPGTESNLPTGEELPPEGAGNGPPPARELSRKHHIKNYDVSHVQEHERLSRTKVTRLTVAVAINDLAVVEEGTPKTTPRSEEELTKVRSLVANAVGLDETRGDSLVVESAAFFKPEGEAPEPEVLPIPDQYKKWVPLASRALLGLVVLVTLLILRRKLKKRFAPTAKEASKGEVHEGELLAGETERKGELPAEPTAEEVAQAVLTAEEEMAALAGEEPTAEAKLAAQRRLAIERATRDPASAALVLRHWLGTAGQQEDREEAA
ncbi:MAG: flagellar M-ring protein FliF, partial [Myxococcales bacterium]|nr:flagellar M-ring protein FliF [Myxococcales bacterium]